MEVVTRQLRSQVCLGQAKDPIVEGKDDTVTFYADMSDGTGDPDPGSAGSTNPVRQPAYDNTNHTCGDDVRGRRHLSGPHLPGSATERAPPLLNTTYRAKDSGGADGRSSATTRSRSDGAPRRDDVQLAGAAVAPADVARAVMVRVSFTSCDQAATSRGRRDATALETDVYTRIADPTDPAKDRDASETALRLLRLRPAGLHDRHPDGRSSSGRTARDGVVRCRQPGHQPDRRRRGQ